MRKYSLPGFLEQLLTQAAYERWLSRRAIAHLRRDRKRGNIAATNEAYKTAIHKAVCSSGGKDAYTAEALSWHLASKYDNEESKRGKRAYKAQFALLPTVDHIGDGLGPADFKICSWRTNDAKADLSFGEFIELCERVVAANEKAKAVTGSGFS